MAVTVLPNYEESSKQRDMQAMAMIIEALQNKQGRKIQKYGIDEEQEGWNRERAHESSMQQKKWNREDALAKAEKAREDAEREAWRAVLGPGVSDAMIDKYAGLGGGSGLMALERIGAGEDRLDVLSSLFGEKPKPSGAGGPAYSGRQLIDMLKIYSDKDTPPGVRAFIESQIPGIAQMAARNPTDPAAIGMGPLPGVTSGPTEAPSWWDNMWQGGQEALNSLRGLEQGGGSRYAPKVAPDYPRDPAEMRGIAPSPGRPGPRVDIDVSGVSKSVADDMGVNVTAEVLESLEAIPDDELEMALALARQGDETYLRSLIKVHLGKFKG